MFSCYRVHNCVLIVLCAYYDYDIMIRGYFSYLRYSVLQRYLEVFRVCLTVILPEGVSQRLSSGLLALNALKALGIPVPRVVDDILEVIIVGDIFDCDPLDGDFRRLFSI